MDVILISLVFFISVTVERMVLPRILLISRKKHLYDIPDARKSHKVATPRLGGTSFTPVILFSYLLGLFFYITYSDNYYYLFTTHFFQELFMVICGIILLLLVGVKDDLIGVSYHNKFYIQAFAAFCFIIGGTMFHNFFGICLVHDVPIWFTIPFSMFIIILVTNAINLIDGIDGLASGLVIVAVFCMGVSFTLHHMMPYAILSAAIIGVLVVFFYYNVFKRQERKLFMGDTGSLSLGFLVAYLVISHSNIPAAYSGDVSSILLPISVLFVPVFDVARVMSVRKLNHKPLFLPDRNHIHHILIDCGLGHKVVMLMIILASLFVVLFNIMLSCVLNINFILLFDIFFGVVFNLMIPSFRHYMKKRQESKKMDLMQTEELPNLRDSF